MRLSNGFCVKSVTHESRDGIVPACTATSARSAAARRERSAFTVRSSALTFRKRAGTKSPRSPIRLRFQTRTSGFRSSFCAITNRSCCSLRVTLMKSALQTPGAVDSDVKEALESLVRTYRTLESGLYYESRPTNPIAAAIHGRVQDDIQKMREKVIEESGMQRLRDADFLGVLAFLQRMEIQQNNGRRLGRAFLDFLRAHFPQTGQDEPAEPQPLITS